MDHPHQTCKVDIRTLLSDPDICCYRALRNGMLVVMVSVFFLPKSFTYCNSNSGLVWSFVVLGELARKLELTIWRYKITTWNGQAKALNVTVNITYRFINHNLNAISAKTACPGQRAFDVHLTWMSAIMECTLATYYTDPVRSTCSYCDHQQL